MKRLLILVFLLAGFVAVNAQNQDPPPRRSAKADPVAFAQDGQTLKITFNQELGEVAISVRNNPGRLVCLKTVNTSSAFVIDITQWDDEPYIISIYNHDGIIKEILFYRE